MIEETSEDDVNELFKDKRSGRIAIVAHCILNQNSRVLDLAERPGMITEIVGFLMHKKIGILQMPCPELAYAGVLRQPQTKDQYDTAMFRSHCRKIAKEIVDQTQDYAKCGIETEIIIGVDGSPSCGVNETSKGSSCENMSKNERVKGSGILMERLRFALKERKIPIPFYGIRYERLSEDLANIEKLLKD
jgi:predicted secreted protein